MNSTYSITSKFQITLPKEIRDDLKLTDKDRVSFERRGQEIVIKKVLSLDEMSKLMQADLKRRGFTKKVTQKDIDSARDIFYKEGGKW